VTKLYLVAVAFGVTLLLASLVLGSKDEPGADGDAGGHGVDAPMAWAPVTSLRFWVFLLAFGGGAGLALEALGSGPTATALGALGVGWAAGALAIAVMSHLREHSASSELAIGELVGSTGTLLLPAAPGRPGKVRVEVKGRTDDYVARVVEGGSELAAGARVLIVAEGDPGTVVIDRGDFE
jgi:hypothetical protein